MKHIIKIVTLTYINFILSCSLLAMEGQQIQASAPAVLPQYNVSSQMLPVSSCSTFEHSPNTFDYLPEVAPQKVLDSMTPEQTAHINTFEHFKTKLLPKLQKEYLETGYNIATPFSITIPINQFIDMLEKNGMDFDEKMERLHEEISENEINNLENLEDFIDTTQALGKKIVSLLKDETKKLSESEKKQSSILKYCSWNYWFGENNKDTFCQSIDDIIKYTVDTGNNRLEISLENYNNEQTNTTLNAYGPSNIVAGTRLLFDNFFTKDAITNRLQTYSKNNLLKHIMPEGIQIKHSLSSRTGFIKKRFFRKNYMFTVMESDEISNNDEMLIQKCAEQISLQYGNDAFFEFVFNKDNNTLYVTTIEESFATYNNKHNALDSTFTFDMVDVFNPTNQSIALIPILEHLKTKNEIHFVHNLDHLLEQLEQLEESELLLFQNTLQYLIIQIMSKIVPNEKSQPKDQHLHKFYSSIAARTFKLMGKTQTSLEPLLENHNFVQYILLQKKAHEIVDKVFENYVPMDITSLRIIFENENIFQISDIDVSFFTMIIDRILELKNDTALVILVAYLHQFKALELSSLEAILENLFEQGLTFSLQSFSNNLNSNNLSIITDPIGIERLKEKTETKKRKILNRVFTLAMLENSQPLTKMLDHYNYHYDRLIDIYGLPCKSLFLSLVRKLLCEPTKLEKLKTLTMLFNAFLEKMGPLNITFVQKIANTLSETKYMPLINVFYRKLDVIIENPEDREKIITRNKKIFDICLPSEKHKKYHICSKFGNHHQVTKCAFDENDKQLDCVWYNPTIGNPIAKIDNCAQNNQTKKIICPNIKLISYFSSLTSYIPFIQNRCLTKPNNPNDLRANAIKSEKDKICQNPTLNLNGSANVRIEKEKHPYIHAFFEQEAKKFMFEDPTIYIDCSGKNTLGKGFIAQHKGTRTFVFHKKVFNNIHYLRYITGHEFEHARQAILEKSPNEVEADIAGAIIFASEKNDCDLVDDKYKENLKLTFEDRKKHNIDAPHDHQSKDYEQWVKRITQAKDPVAVKYLEKIIEENIYENEVTDEVYN